MLTETTLISFPKSGRTWLRVLLGKVLCDYYNRPDRRALETRHGQFDFIWSHEGSDWDTDRPSVHFSQLQCNKDEFRNRRVIFLMRDPRDIVVSWFFQCTKREKSFSGALPEFIRSENYGIPKIRRFYELWYHGITIPRECLLLSYEVLYRDTIQALKVVLAFVGLHGLSDELVTRTVDFASFANLHRLEEHDYFGSSIMRPADASDPESFKTRIGRPGSHVNYLSDLDLSYIDSVMQPPGCGFFSPWASYRNGKSRLTWHHRPLWIHQDCSPAEATP